MISCGYGPSEKSDLSRGGLVLWQAGWVGMGWMAGWLAGWLAGWVGWLGWAGLGWLGWLGWAEQGWAGWLSWAGLLGFGMISMDLEGPLDLEGSRWIWKVPGFGFGRISMDLEGPRPWICNDFDGFGWSQALDLEGFQLKNFGLT